MYFHEVKSTAHPPIIGAQGHSTVCIGKQPNTVAINIYFTSCKPALSCWRRNSGPRSLKSTTTATMVGGPKEFGGTKGMLLYLLVPPNHCSVPVKNSNSISCRPQNYSVPSNSICGHPFWDLRAAAVLNLTAKHSLDSPSQRN